MMLVLRTCRLSQIADTLLKLACLPGRRRGAVMLSRRMQIEEFGRHDYLQSTILRPVVQWQWNETRGWVLDDFDQDNLDLIIRC